MTEHDIFKGILSDVALYQNNKSQYLYFFNNALQHDHRYVKHMPLPSPTFPERTITRCPLGAFTSVMIFFKMIKIKALI